MNLSSLAVKRGVTFSMVFLMVLGFGLFGLSRLQLDLFPDLTFPTVVVITSYTGASPEDMETLVTDPIEGAVSAVKRVEEVRSESKQGVSVVEVKFDWDVDMEQAETDVRRQLELVEGALPDDADDPLVFAFDPSMQPVMTLAVNGPYPLDELRTLTEDEIKPRVERLDGVATASVSGGLEREIHVLLDPTTIEAYGLDLNQVVSTIYTENAQEPGGVIRTGARDFSILTQGKYSSVEEIGEVLVGMAVTAGGAEPIRLAQVATIEDSFVESERIFEVDGQSAVALNIRKQSGENTVQTAEAVLAAMPAIESAAGEGIELKVLDNQADYIEDSLGNLASTAVIGVIIAFVVLFLFLRNARAAAIVSAAIPMSIIATFAVMDQASMTLNIMSTAGLALAVGMLVDNAVVVLENIFRLREQGMGRREAAIEGARTVSRAVIASTLTTVAVFVPVLFVPGFAGVLFHDMAITITFALAVSLAVALTFIPLAASRTLGGKEAGSGSGAPSSGGLFNRIRDGYGRALDYTLEHRWVVAAGLAAALLITAGLATRLPTDFMARGDQSEAYITLSAPVGSSLEETYDHVEEAVQIIEQVVPADEYEHITVDVGTGGGIEAMFSGGIHEATVQLALVPMGDRDRSQSEIEAAIREALMVVPGLEVSVGDPMGPSGSVGDLEIQIQGHDLEHSREIGEALRVQLEAMPSMGEVTYSMDEHKPQLRVTFDRPKMTELGLSTGQVGKAISTAFKGRVAGRYSEDGDEVDILVRYDTEFRDDLDALQRMPIVTSSGDVIRLDTIADVALELGPTAIERRDQGRMTTLVCVLADSYVDADGAVQGKNLGGAIGDVEAMLEGYDWPAGFTYDVGGAADDFSESFIYLGIALLVSVLLVYMVMASQFESLRQPFIILFTVPLAIIGVVALFALTSTTLDVASLIGVIMLVGIVVNNGIVMVDAANQLREQGLGRFEAIARASRQRLRPVLLTSLTTIFSMVPMALEIGAGSEQWSGMARAVIGGLLASTALTLFVVPTIYTLFAGEGTAKASATARTTPAVAA